MKVGDFMNKAYKFRAMPNAEQRILFAKTVGCARFVYNRMLADKIAHYKETGKMLHNTPAQYKAEFPFLREVDSMALCNAQIQAKPPTRISSGTNLLGSQSSAAKSSRARHIRQIG